MMLRTLKWIGGLLILAALAGFLQWSLPSRDIVRIIGTEVARMDYRTTDAAGNKVVRTRDVRFIEAVWPDGAPRVYRNEDTDWGWPPYLKFDSANLHAEAQDRISAAAAPRWVIVTHYGWRIPMFSMFPNAVGIEETDDPNQTLIPWFNIVILSLLVVGALVLWRLAILLFRRRGDVVAEGRRRIFGRRH